MRGRRLVARGWAGAGMLGSGWGAQPPLTSDTQWTPSPARLGGMAPHWLGAPETVLGLVVIIDDSGHVLLQVAAGLHPVR